jgi:hypothetical protein
MAVQAGVMCPYCGGKRVRQITPGEFECVTPHPGGLVPPGAGDIHPMRPCAQRFQIATSTRTPLCTCGRESIGQCKDCGAPLCGLHGTESGEFLCGTCQEDRQARKFAREAEEEQGRRIGLIDFRELVNDARKRRESWAGGATTGNDGETDLAPGSGFEHHARVPFGRVWDLVAGAILTRSPPADIMVIDGRRVAELPERWPKRGGERRKRRFEARWNEAADKLAIAAWDLEASFSSGSGIADTYSRQETPMYFGSNGVLYVGAGSQTPLGTHAGGTTHHTPDSVPEVWHEKWGAWGTIDNCHEIATGFANLVVKHSLTIDR